MSWLDQLYRFQSGTSRLQNLADWARLPFMRGLETGDVRRAIGQTVADIGGRMGIPEIGISRWIAPGEAVDKRYTIAQALAPTNQTLIDQQQLEEQRQRDQQLEDQQQGDVLGLTTTTTDTGDGGGVRGLSPEELANQQRQSQLNSILGRLQMMRDVAQRNIGQARGIRDEVVGNIGGTFANLRQQAEGRRDAALATLGQEDVDVQNLYGRAGGTARRAMESALTRNRMAARAMNRLDSSFYDDRQAGVVEGGRQAVSDLAQEEAGKRAAIGTRQTETRNWFEQQASTIEQEEAGLKSQAEREYQQQVNTALDMERAYGIDSLAAAEQAENEFQSKLNQIENYVNERGFRLLEIAAATGQNLGGVINQFSAMNDQLSRALGVNRGLSRAQGLADTMPTIGGVTTADQLENYLPFYQQQGQTQSEVEERLRRIFGYR